MVGNLKTALKLSILIFTAKYVLTTNRINILQVVLPNEKKISAFRDL